jgi:hypothetical protein
VTDLHPLAGFTLSFAEDTSGLAQVGYARIGNGTLGINNDRAMLWTGTGSSATNLHPTLLTGFERSTADGVSPTGLQQVGYGYINATNQFHALVWAGTAASATDLHPTNLPGTWFESYALATNDTKQVGYGESDNTDFNYHALMWSGTANSAVDLHPTNIPGGFVETQANGISGTGNHQVGWGDGTATSGSTHALLWSGSGGSAVDLHPTLLTGFTDSYANGCNDTIQVGKAFHTPDDAYHAMAWIGTADSAMDLQALLPTTNGGFWLESAAYAVDANGNVWGVARGTPDSSLPGGFYAVEWSVPEPDIAALMCMGFIALLQRQRASRASAR